MLLLLLLLLLMACFETGAGRLSQQLTSDGLDLMGGRTDCMCWVVNLCLFTDARPSAV